MYFLPSHPVMMHFRQAIVVLDKKEYPLIPGKINSFDTFYVDFQHEPSRGNSGRYALFLHPKQDVLVEKIELQFELPFSDFSSAVTFAFRSAGDSVEQDFTAKTKPQPGLFKGDTSFNNIPAGRGLLHAWSYLLFKGSNKQILAASTNESAGFTSLLYDAERQILTVRKDVGNGLRMTHSFPALDFWWGDGGFAQLQSDLEIVPKKQQKALVWSAAAIMGFDQLEQQVEMVAQSGLPFTHFCLGNGWQTQNGDWIGPKQAPKHQLSALIRSKGLRPALTFSPFTASVQSDLARQHPDWLVQYNGKPILVTTANGGDAYALDVYHAGVREYIAAVFYQFTERWGFDTFFLEDLSAACAWPKLEKTRGQLMEEATTLIRSSAGNAYLIAAQVPVGAAIGHYDAVQMGSPLYRMAKDKLDWLLTGGHLNIQPLLAAQYIRNAHLQIAGNPIALRSTLDKKSARAQYMHLIAQALCSDILMVSDDLGAYTPELRAELEEAVFFQQATIVAVSRLLPHCTKIVFEVEGTRYMAYFNWMDKKMRVGDGERGFELEGLEGLVL
ncbi:MAG: hypothetical protein RIR11_2795 [Bacteroidota bacterium]